MSVTCDCAFGCFYGIPAGLIWPAGFWESEFVHVGDTNSANALFMTYYLIALHK